MTRNWHTIATPRPSRATPWSIGSLASCPHGLEIILVDGMYVRNHYDSDFSQGGNGYRYTWIPKDQIWIDWQISEDERLFIAFHECHEAMLMKKGSSYGKAHDEAKRLENQHRHAALTESASLPRRQEISSILLNVAKYLDDPDLPTVPNLKSLRLEPPFRLASFLRTDANLVDHPDKIPEKSYVLGDLKMVVRYLSSPIVKAHERRTTPFPYELPSSRICNELREIIRDLG